MTHHFKKYALRSTITEKVTTVSHTAIMYNLNISQGNVSMGKGSKKRHVYMAYLAILSILFVHENLEDWSIFWKVLNRRGGWVGGWGRLVSQLVTLSDFFCDCVSGSFNRTERP